VGNTIENCGFFTNGLNPFLACSGGTNSGRPCQQYCANGSVPGSNCRVDADCAGGGTCQQTDCSLGGTTDSCTVAASVRPVGDGDVTVIDSDPSSSGTTVRNIAIYDLERSQGVITVQENSTVAGVLMDCTRVVPATYTAITTGSPKVLCWPSLQLSPFVLTTAPALAIDAAVTVDTGSVVIGNTLRATTTGIVGASSSQIERNVVPPDGGNNYYTGAGAWAAPATAIDAGAFSGVRIRANVVTAIGVGVKLGTTSLLDGNRISATPTGAIGIRVEQDQDRITSNYVTAFWGLAMVPPSAHNNTVLGNNFYGGKGAKLVLTGAGHRVVGNYLAWYSGDGGLCAGGTNDHLACASGGDCPSSTCVPDPVMWIGSPDHGLSGLSTDNVINGVAHVIVVGNELFTNSTATGTALVKAADTGTSCSGGATPGKYCTGGDCGAGTCAVTASSLVEISDNSMLAADVGIDLTGINSATHTMAGVQVNANLFSSLVDLGIAFPSTGLSQFLGSSNSLSGAAATVTGWSSTFGTLQGQADIVLNAAGCNSATSAPAWDFPTTNAASTACLGTDLTSGVLSYPDGSTTYATAHFGLPLNWIQAAGMDLKLVYSGDTSSTSNIDWRVSTACVADNESLTGPTFNTTSTSSGAAGPTTTPQRKTYTFQNVNTQSGSTCAPGETAYVKVERLGGSDAYGGAAYLSSVTATLWRVQ
jgi:hypothetical protein